MRNDNGPTHHLVLSDIAGFSEKLAHSSAITISCDSANSTNRPKTKGLMWSADRYDELSS